MADDGDDEKKALEAKVAALKASMKNISTQTQADTFLGELSSLAIEAERLGVPLDVSVIEKAITAKVQSYNVDKDIDNQLNAKETDKAASEEKEEHKITEERLAQGIIQYDKIEKELHDQLDNDISLIKKAANDPKSLTPDEIRKLKGEDLTPEEVEEEKRKHSHLNVLSNIMDDTKKANEHDDRRIKEIDEKLKTPPNENVKKDLEQEKNDYKERKDQRNQDLNKRIDPVIKKMNQEREALLKLAEKSPDYAIDKLKKHVEYYDKLYKAELKNNPDYQGLKKLQEVIKKLEPQEELTTQLQNESIKTEPAPQKTTSQLSKNSNPNTVKTNNKQKPTLGEGLLKGKINGKDAVKQIKNGTEVNTASFKFPITPGPSPNIKRLANKGKELE